ncbi:Glycosyl transferase family 2 [Brevibacterium siliguriense]|uniref:Glycosyl transferase family 2 n=2 Tax=Brevibacterium siliguriense TaxID=1136497 RepID=A0A1H1QKP1_9MICO|nr:glycosyltransferase family 2 protein [Brevibacterium siliguriense]SDS24061.1 Glycosyl transferase family 2 [Brevibacterium siliguriense]
MSPSPPRQPPNTSRADAVIDVSVIIPVYNCEKFIVETIDSVRQQTLEEGRYEIIAVDDGSTDSSLSILSDLAENKTDLRVFSIPNSGSAAAPRNRGVDEAVGRYLFFLDADDKLDRDTLKRLVHMADTTGSGVVLCKLGSFGDGPPRPVPSKPFSSNQYAVDFIESKANSTLSVQKLFRRTIVDEHNIRFPAGFAIGEDQPFALKAFLHSPHISILADKPYYWLRHRGDGTNVTSRGQTPRKHLERILSLVDTIEENTEPGLRRDVLLRRPLVGKAGTLAVFGRKLIPAHGRAEREEMLTTFSDRITHLWNPRVRKYGSVSSQILVDLVVRNDLDEIERVSASLRTRGFPSLEFDWELSQFFYRPLSGGPVSDLNVKMRTHLTRIKYTQGTAALSGEIGIQGVNEAPYSAELVAKHRQSGAEDPVQLDVSQTNKGIYGIRSRFQAQLDLRSLPEPGTWDVLVHARWGELELSEHLGHSKPKGIDTRPVLHGNPTHTAAFFTPAGNFAIDVGPTAVHLDSVHQIRPVQIGRFTVGRNEIIEVDAVPSDLISASAKTKRTKKSTEVKLVRHCGTRAAVIVPRSVTRKGPIDIVMFDAHGRSVTVTSKQQDELLGSQ